MRLIDLHCDWLRQYATESTLFDRALYGEVNDRLDRLNGYLQGTAAAVLFCGRKREEWERQSDRWGSLAEMLAVYEAEFAGRLLIAPADVERFGDEPADGLAWGTLAIAGFDYLVREPADLDRLPALFERGVRVFQVVETAASVLAGCAESGDDRGLTDLGHAFLGSIGDLSDMGLPGPMPIVDLAGMSSRSIAAALDWFESAATCHRHVAPIFSHGGVCQQSPENARAIRGEHLVRLRALGGLVGVTPTPPFYQTPEELRAGIEAIASVPFEGRVGYEGIAIATDFLARDEALPGLAEVAHIKRWVGQVFDRPRARRLLHDNGLRLLTRAAGVLTDGRPEI